MKTAVIIEDSIYMRSLIKLALTKQGFEILDEAANGADGIDKAIELNPDLITLDNVLPDIMGMDILKTLKNEEGLTSKIVMVSAVGQQSVVNKCMEIGASGYVVKPFQEEAFITTVNELV